MRAIILAGGRGTRMRPYTHTIPKPLLPVQGDTILGLLLNHLKQNGCSRATLCVGYMSDLIISVFGDGAKWGLEIDYVTEDKPLGTAGPLNLVPDLPDNFLVLNADVLCDIDYGHFFQTHIEHTEPITLAVTNREHRIDYGVVSTDDRGRVTGYTEKPENKYQVSCGIYCLWREVVDAVPRGYFDMPDLIQAFTNHNMRSVRTYGPVNSWWDLGRREDLERLNEEVEV